MVTVENDFLSVAVSLKGAELQSVRSRVDGTEYIWQPQKGCWQGRAPWLFPICSNLYEKRYTYQGVSYPMHSHGFAAGETFRVTEKSLTGVTLTLEENENTLAVYPFRFRFSIRYQLEGKTLAVTATIENSGKTLLPATCGAHPGFSVPLQKGLRYEDYFLEFSEVCSPDEILLTKTCFNSGKKRAYPLKEGKILPLSKELFVVDGVFLQGAAHSVTLKSSKDSHAVTVSFPDMPYVGFWSEYQKDAAFVCIEPWCGLPSYDGEVDDFATKNDMFRIPPAGKKQFHLTYQFS